MVSSVFNKTARDFADALKNAGSSKTSPYDIQAEVKRIEGDTAWVHIPGGVDETPVQLTTNAKKGDIVQVRVSGGRAWLYGNATSPPTDDTVANKAQKTAAVADEHATNAVTSAMLAQQFADAAKDAADSAQADATIAKTVTDEITAYAEIADKSVTDILEDAEDANIAAGEAKESARAALNNLSDIERVVDVLGWISQHGQYTLTDDTEVVSGKYYFTLSGMTYAVVSNPTGDPNSQGWYELTNVDAAISNYVASHLALDNSGLWLQTDNVASKLLLSNTDGFVIYGDNGPLAKYGTDAVIGKEDGFHIKIDGTEIGFYQAAQKVAYINGNKLYITQSVVLQQMDVGTPVLEGGLGQWSWKVHDVNGANNLYLKWLG